jgi:hypothetical protein
MSELNPTALRVLAQLRQAELIAAAEQDRRYRAAKHKAKRRERDQRATAPRPRWWLRHGGVGSLPPTSP